MKINLYNDINSREKIENNERKTVIKKDNSKKTTETKKEKAKGETGGNKNETSVLPD